MANCASVCPFTEDPNPDSKENNTEPPDCYGFCIEPSTSTKPTRKAFLFIQLKKQNKLSYKFV